MVELTVLQGNKMNPKEAVKLILKMAGSEAPMDDSEKQSSDATVAPEAISEDQHLSDLRRVLLGDG